MCKFLIRIIYFFIFLQLLFLSQNKNENDTHHSKGLEGNNHKGISSASGAPIEYVCFSHQSSLFSVLFNLFTFGPYWRGTVYWFIVPRFLRVPLRAHKAPPHSSATPASPASGLLLLHRVAWLLASVSKTGLGRGERTCPSITRTSQGEKKY